MQHTQSHRVHLRFALRSLLYIWLLVPTVVFAETDWVSKAIEARKAKNYPATIKYLKKAIEQSPQPVLLNNLGKIYEEVGRYDLAFKAYKLVVDDPNADPALRALDQERMARIQPKLSQTMVVVAEAMPWKRVWINGAAYPMGTGIEMPVPSGELSIDLFNENEGNLIRMTIDGEGGRRLTLDLESIANLDEKFGVMSWERSGRKLTSISIDDALIKAPTKKTKGVQIAPGTYQVVLNWVGMPVQKVNVQIEAGKLIELKPEPAPPPIATATPKAPLPPPTIVPVDPPPAHALTTPPPAETRKTFNWSGAGQITVALLGMGLGAFGYSMYTQGASDRDDVRADQNDNITPESLSQYIQWEKSNDAATAKLNQGLWLTSMGSLTVVAGAMWWLLADTANDTTAVHLDSRNGTLFNGEF